MYCGYFYFTQRLNDNFVSAKCFSSSNIFHLNFVPISEHSGAATVRKAVTNCADSDS